MKCSPQAVMITSFAGRKKCQKQEADSWAVEYLQKIYFEMSGAQFDTLPNMLEIHIKKNWTNYCNPVDPHQQLAVW